MTMATKEAYKDHRPGTAKGEVHRVYDDKGPEAAIKKAVALGKLETTARTWISSWKSGVGAKKTVKAKAPATKKATAKKATVKKTAKVKKPAAKKAPAKKPSSEAAQPEA